MARIGVIAGRGKLPGIWSREAVKKGHDVYIFALEENIEVFSFSEAEDIIPVNIDKFGHLLSLLNEKGIEKAVLLGNVDKKRLFEGAEPDEKLKKMLVGLENLSNDSLLMGFVREIEKTGIDILSQQTYLEELIPQEGVLTSISPDDEVVKDMEYGFNLAREIARLEIGQTVIVKKRVVLAVETIEGTDETIKRGARLGNKGIVMAKVSKPSQDFRFDLPTVGMETLDILKEVDACGLVVEAGKTIFIQKDKFIEKAEKAGIVVAALEG